MNASVGGAKEVYAVDISSKACEDIIENVRLNNINNIKVLTKDVFDYLREEDVRDKFDCIILDPPAFTKSKETIKKAYKGYFDINYQAMKIIKKGGILCTFSCSEHMTFPLFLEMLMDASEKVKRDVRIIDMRIQSPDHPISLNMKQSLYLKCVILNVM